MIYVLPYPVSTNRYWRNFRGYTVRSKEANQYKEIVKALSIGSELKKGGV